MKLDSFIHLTNRTQTPPQWFTLRQSHHEQTTAPTRCPHRQANTHSNSSSSIRFPCNNSSKWRLLPAAIAAMPARQEIRPKLGITGSKSFHRGLVLDKLGLPVRGKLASRIQKCRYGSRFKDHHGRVQFLPLEGEVLKKNMIPN